MIFEELFAKTDNEKILDKLEEIKQLMVPKVVYVPIYVEQKPWWYCEPINTSVNYVYPEKYDCVDALRYAFSERFTYGVDYAEHVCLGSSVVST